MSSNDPAVIDSPSPVPADAYAPPAVPYADAGGRWGIKVFADEGRLVIDVPSLGWRAALRALKPAAVCTAVLGTVVVAIGAGLATRTWLDGAVVFVAFLATGITTTWGIATAARRTSDATVFHVTADEFVVRQRDGERTGGWYEQRWPRALVAEIKPDLPRMGLMIRIVGKARLQLLEDHPPEVRRWVAERLREALGRTAAADTRSPGMGA